MSVSRKELLAKADELETEAQRLRAQARSLPHDIVWVVLDIDGEVPRVFESEADAREFFRSDGLDISRYKLANEP